MHRERTMERKLKFAQYGCGTTASILLKYMINKGAEPVAIIDRNAGRRGKLIEEVWPECGAQGLRITPPEDAADLLRETKPDICIIATRSTMNDIMEPFENCAKAGVSAITIAEEAVYPYNSSPEKAAYLDRLAKEAGVVFSASGFTDTYWGSLVTTLAGSLNMVEEIEGYCLYSAYAETLAAYHGVGLTVEEFEEQFGTYNRMSPEKQQQLVLEGKFEPISMWNQNGWLCSKMGLTAVSQKQICQYETREDAVYSTELHREFEPGLVTGSRFTAVTETAEGITIKGSCAARVFTPEDREYTSWSIKGEPDVSMRFDMKDANYQTCSNLINRIPAVLNSSPGFVTSDRFENCTYMTDHIGSYVK